MSKPDNSLFPLPRLVCDVGGTHIRFGAIAPANQELRLLQHRLLDDFQDFTEACRAAVQMMDPAPASLLVCGAGPATGRRMKLTNSHWEIDGPKIAGMFGLQNGLLLNDFEAVALSLPAMTPDSMTSILTPGTINTPEGTRLVIGAGTGLGVAALLKCDCRYLAVPSEAGHIAIAAADPEEEEIFVAVERVSGRLTAETLISGPGLERLHRARSKFANRAPDIQLTAAEIAAYAQHNPQGPEAATVQHFWRLSARYAGDMALAFAARAGVFLAGGVWLKLLPMLDREDFRACFQDKAPMRNMIADIRVALLGDEYAVLRGLAQLAQRPEDYAVDFHSRCWRKNDV